MQPRITVSPMGLFFIKKYQGVSLVRYEDEAKIPIIGYGHVILCNEQFPACISQETADLLLIQDLCIIDETLNNLLQVNLTQNQYDAVASLVMSQGIDAFCCSPVLALLNQHNFPQALTLWQQDITINSVDCHSLVSQRLAECQLFSGNTLATYG